MVRTRTKPFHERMAQARTDKGFSLDEVAYRMRDVVPEPWRCSRATISRMESRAADEASVDPVQVWALAQIYEKPLTDLSPFAAEALERMTALLSEHIDRYMHQWCSQLQFGQAEGYADWGDVCTPTKNYSISTRAANVIEDSHPTRSAATAASSERSSEPCMVAA